MWIVDAMTSSLSENATWSTSSMLNGCHIDHPCHTD